MADKSGQKGMDKSARTSATADRGAVTDPNPGERSMRDAQLGAPVNSLGVRPAQGNRAGGGRQIDRGAQLGIMLNMEFAAGGRAHRLITGSESSVRPAFDPKSGALHTAAAVDTNVSALGPGANDGPSNATERVESTPTDDSSTGDVSRDRMRDEKGT